MPAIYTKVYEECFSRDERLKEQIAQAWKDELEDCTFSPTSRSQGSPRSVAKFLEDQTNLAKHKEQQLQKLVREKEKAVNSQLLSKPNISAV